MATRKAIKGVLHCFLGTFTSRYPDIGGYWLFGYIVDSLTCIHVNLLSSDPSLDDTVQSAVITEAISRFNDQLAKRGLATSLIHEATLEIKRNSEIYSNTIYGVPVKGWDLMFIVRVTMDNGHVYQATTSRYVVPQQKMAEIRHLWTPNVP